MFFLHWGLEDPIEIATTWYREMVPSVGTQEYEFHIEKKGKTLLGRWQTGSSVRSPPMSPQKLGKAFRKILGLPKGAILFVGFPMDERIGPSFFCTASSASLGPIGVARCMFLLSPLFRESPLRFSAHRKCVIFTIFFHRSGCVRLDGLNCPSFSCSEVVIVIQPNDSWLRVHMNLAMGKHHKGTRLFSCVVASMVFLGSWWLAHVPDSSCIGNEDRSGI